LRGVRALGQGEGEKERPFSVFKDLQILLVQEGTQRVNHAGGVAQFSIKGFPDGADEGPVGDFASGSAGALEGGCRFDQIWEVIFPEVRFRLCEAFECEGFGFLEGVKGGLFAEGGFPISDGLFSGDDLNFVLLESQKAHPAAEAFLVQFSDGDLVAVIAGGAQPRSGGTASGDAGVVALGRLNLRDLFPVVLRVEFTKGIPLQLGPVEAEGRIADLEKGAFGVERGDSHGMAFWLFEEETRSGKQGESSSTLADLFGDIGGS
jgi:hypothetical protein